MTQTADAIVVGGGLEGLSTAYHLATAGYEDVPTPVGFR
jgi:glycine/D-amino acid oxidase-like deaminating enzyme